MIRRAQVVGVLNAHPGREWTPASMASALHADPRAVGPHLRALHAIGALERLESGAYRLWPVVADAPPPPTADAAQVAQVERLGPPPPVPTVPPTITLPPVSVPPPSVPRETFPPIRPAGTLDAVVEAVRRRGQPATLASLGAECRELFTAPAEFHRAVSTLVDGGRLKRGADRRVGLPAWEWLA